MATASEPKGGLRAALSQQKKLGIEAAVVLVVLAVGAFLVFHFVVKTIRNTRPLGGANVVVTHGYNATENETSFAIDSRRADVIFGGSNELRTYTSLDGGRSWRGTAGPPLPVSVCPHGEPKAAAAGARQVIAFLAGSPCGDDITPYLVVTSRAGPGGRWSRPVRVAQPAWKYGFDDAPSIAAGPTGQTLYLSWTRGLSGNQAGVVVSRSDDAGRTWSRPVVVAPPANRPHLSSIAVARNGDVYAAGIDAKHGIWISRSTNDGRTFTPPQTATPLHANPAGTCATATAQPLPKDETSCIGPDPTVLATDTGAFVVYDDVGANRTQDVYIASVGPDLRRRFVRPVTPPDRGSTQQFFPVAARDGTTGALWACWYDTTFDPHGHRAWFTCSASRTGRTWSSPERAAEKPTMVSDLYTDLQQTNGFTPSLVAGRGIAHPFWIGIDPGSFRQDIVTARLPEHAALAVAP